VTSAHRAHAHALEALGDGVAVEAHGLEAAGEEVAVDHRVAPLAVAQQYAYKPPLGDIMGKIQLRHIKLWFAGKLANWELATYETDEIRASLEQAADLYRGSRSSLAQYRRPDRSDRQSHRGEGQRRLRQGLWRLHGRLQCMPRRDRPGFIIIAGPDRLALYRPVVCAAVGAVGLAKEPHLAQALQAKERGQPFRALPCDGFADKWR
jgi:hypothetical protein